MKPLRLIETRPGYYSLLLNAGATASDDTIVTLGHEPNGYFWEGLAQLAVQTGAPNLEGKFAYDPEADTFCAYGNDRDALTKLGSLVAELANDPGKLKALMAKAEELGFEFDD